MGAIVDVVSAGLGRTAYETFDQVDLAASECTSNLISDPVRKRSLVNKIKF